MVVRFSNAAQDVAVTAAEVATMTTKMINPLDERQARRMAADREELAERIARLMPRDGDLNLQPGLNLVRFARPTELHHGFLDPCLCVIAQGAKTLTLGEDVFRYDPAHYMIATVGVPMTAQVVEASPDRPYLCFRLALDPAVVAAVMVETGLAKRAATATCVPSPSANWTRNCSTRR